MRSAEDTALIIAASSIFDVLPRGETLDNRLLFAMRYVRTHKADLLWMVGRPGENLMMRSAIGAVIMTAKPDEVTKIENSLKIMKSLDALLSGVPVDVDALNAQMDAHDTVPIIRLWHESAS